MKKFFVPALLAGLMLFAVTIPASAQTIPNVRGLQPFTAETNFMSLTGYVRWQYFVENNTWISRAEAASLASAQTSPSASAR